MAGSHKRELAPRPSLRRTSSPRALPRAVSVAAPVALLVTAIAVGTGVALSAPGDARSVARSDVAAPLRASASSSRTPELSRSIDRAPVVPAGTLTPLPTHPAWATADLNLYTGPGPDAPADGELAAGVQVTATDVTRHARVEVIFDSATRWVTGSYLSDQKPLAAIPGLSDAPCPDSSIEHGLKPQTVRVYRALCHAFPQVTQWAGLAPRSEHDTGNAIDAMVYGDKALGDAIAAWARQHAAELDLYDLIWYDRIWTPVRASEGWRDYGDHGSPTANHMDHVHLGTN